MCARRSPEPACVREELAPGSWIHHDPAFLGAERAEELGLRLREELAFESHVIRLFGREVAEPRLSAWHGRPGRTYRYSGRDRVPAPLTPTLLELLDLLEERLGERFDGVLGNLYRDGADSMGWHADDEPCFGPEPTIASLNFGAARRFLLRPRRGEAGGLEREFSLGAGSLLVMGGCMQRTHRHAVPKTRRPVGWRLNLTFRRFVTLGDAAADA